MITFGRVFIKKSMKTFPQRQNCTLFSMQLTLDKYFKIMYYFESHDTTIFMSQV